MEETRQLNFQQRCHLRNEVLAVCAGKTHNMPELISIHSKNGWPPKEIKKMVYALENAGLLFGRGKARGRVYRTTKEARQLL